MIALQVVVCSADNRLLGGGTAKPCQPLRTSVGEASWGMALRALLVVAASASFDVRNAQIKAMEAAVLEDDWDDDDWD